MPTRSIALAPPVVVREDHADRIVLHCPVPLPSGPPTVVDWLERWAKATPDRIFLGERGPDGAWQRTSYAQAASAVAGIGTALLELGCHAQAPLAVLSGNSTAHALLVLGAMWAGVPAAPISAAYSLQSSDFARLRTVVGALQPAVVFADNAPAFAPALAATGLSGVPLVATAGAELSVDALARTVPVDRPVTGPDTIAKILFTSGSTGVPRGIVTTHRMLVANQEALAALWPFLDEDPPVLVDWLPWSHCFGGSFDFHLVLRAGGTLFIDEGRPAPGLIERTAANLRDVSPSLYFNVPRGFELLLPHLETDEALRTSFFGKLRTVFFAGAALPPVTRARLEAVAALAGRDDLFFSSAWGSTETAPLSTLVHFPTDTPAIIGLPVPGVDVSLAVVGDRHEIRVRGPNVSPGVWRGPGDVVPLKLDAHGFHPSGDAVELVDAGDASRGIAFGGRLGENFKLTSGVWVTVGRLRLAILDATGDLVRDAVVAGEGRDTVGLLLFAGPAWDAPGADPAALTARLRDALTDYNRVHRGSSEQITRAVVLHEPPSLDAGETTDKGYTNQRRVLERRAAEVARLFGGAEADGVVRITG